MGVPSLKQICLMSLDTSTRQKILEEDSIVRDVYIDCVKNVYDVELTKYGKLTKKSDLIIAGQVQSGKTKDIINYCMWSMFVCLKPVVLVLRNSLSDIKQFKLRFESYGYKDVNLITTDKKQIKPKEITANTLILNIYNRHRLKRCIEFVKGVEFNLCMDEADIMIKGNTQTRKYIEQLEEQSGHVTRYTATYSDIQTVRKIDDVIYMKEPEHYFGFKNVDVRKIKNTFDYLEIIEEISKYDEFLLLCTISAYNAPNTMNAYSVNEDYDLLTMSLTYKGTHVYLPSNVFIDIPKKYSRKIKEKEEGHYVITNMHVSDILQFFKELGVDKRIVMFAGYLASRGTSFVSKDYEWHLTDQIFGMSTTNKASLMQYMRCFGVYKDDVVPRLWMKENKYKVLKYYHEDLFEK